MITAVAAAEPTDTCEHTVIHGGAYQWVCVLPKGHSLAHYCEPRLPGRRAVSPSTNPTSKDRP